MPFSDVVSFELRVQNSAVCKRLLFSFDVEADTVENVGLELEAEFNLTAEEREQFTDMLRQELERVLRKMMEDDSKDVGPIVVSMSLDDWTNARKGSNSVATSHLDSTSRVTDASISFKLTMGKSRSMHSMCSDQNSQTLHNVEEVIDGADEKKTESRGGMYGTDEGSGDSGKLISQNNSPPPPKFDRLGLWQSVLNHIQKKAASLRENSLNRSLGKALNLRGEQDVANRNKLALWATDTANIDLEEARLAAGNTASTRGVSMVSQEHPKRMSVSTCPAAAVLECVASDDDAGVSTSAGANKDRFKIQKKSMHRAWSKKEKQDKVVLECPTNDDPPMEEDHDQADHSDKAPGCLIPWIKNGTFGCGPLRKVMLKAQSSFTKRKAEAVD